MTREQFDILINKLEEIRCGVVDVEVASESRTAAISADLIEVRNLFFVALEQKPGWGRNELKELFDDLLSTFIKE